MPDKSRHIKLQKVAEENSGQHKGTVLTVRRVTPMGHRACSVRCFLLKGISPLKYCSLTVVEAQVEISLVGSRLTFLGPLQVPYIVLREEGAAQNDTSRGPGQARIRIRSLGIKRPCSG